jgi:hypothetical protein
VHCANQAATNGRGRLTPTHSATPAMSNRGSLPGTPPEGAIMEDTRGGTAAKRAIYQVGASGQIERSVPLGAQSIVSMAPGVSTIVDGSSVRASKSPRRDGQQDKY